MYLNIVTELDKRTDTLLPETTIEGSYLQQFPRGDLPLGLEKRHKYHVRCTICTMYICTTYQEY